MGSNNFFDGIEDTECLISKLKEKALNHQIYSFYGKREGIIKTIEKSTLRLTNGVGWNDKIDTQNLCNNGKVRFVKCFTYSKSENIAMWMLYSDPSEEGYMLSFSNSIISNILKVDEIKIVDINNKTYTLKKPDFKIELIDVVYVGVGDSENKLALKKSIYGVKAIEASHFNFDIENNKYDYFAKSYGWSYENECRLVIECDKNQLENKIDYSNECYINLAINFKPNSKAKTKLVLAPNNKDDSDEKTKTKLILAPNNKDVLAEKDIEIFERNNIIIENSNYHNKINWSIKNNYLDYFIKNEDIYNELLRKRNQYLKSD